MAYYFTRSSGSSPKKSRQNIVFSSPFSSKPDGKFSRIPISSLIAIVQSQSPSIILAIALLILSETSYPCLSASGSLLKPKSGKPLPYFSSSRPSYFFGLKTISPLILFNLSIPSPQSNNGNTIREPFNQNKSFISYFTAARNSARIRSIDLR